MVAALESTTQRSFKFPSTPTRWDLQDRKSFPQWHADLRRVVKYSTAPTFLGSQPPSFNVQLLSLVRAQSSAASGEAARVRIAQFDAREYFTATMDITTFHLKAGDFRSDFSALPSERTSACNSFFRSFLTKLPPTLKTERRQFESALLQSEIVGTPLPWKFEQLVQLAANYNVLAARDAADGHSVCMADGAQKSKTTKSPVGKPVSNQPCPCCGKQGHYARDCPTACSICKHRSCPGNYGGPCAVTAPSFPATVHNALGRPLPLAIKRILQKAVMCGSHTPTSEPPRSAT